MDAAASDAQMPAAVLPLGMQPSTWAGLWVLLALAVLTGVRLSLRHA